MNAVPEISIITPVWNGLPYIKECIDSVLSQEFKNWELLVGDNCSTDGTREYLNQLNDPRIRVFNHDKNRGIFGNLNFLFDQAQAPLAYILCADDYFYPNGLGNTISDWKNATPNTGLICHNAKENLSYSKLMRYSYSVLPGILEPVKSKLAFFLFGNFIGNLSNVSLKVDALRASGRFVENLKTAGDFEMWSRMTLKYDLILSNTLTVHVRRHEGVASNYMTKNGEAYHQQVVIFERLIEQLTPVYDRKNLLLYFHVNTCTQHFRTAIRSALYGNFNYMMVLLRTKSSILWPKWLQLFSCFPLGLTEGGRESLSVHLAKNFINQHK